MPVFGDLGTMPLPDVLQWVGGARKTGMLELDAGAGVRQIEFRKGFIGSCCSDDPDQRIGQFLVARGCLTAEQLENVMARQMRGGERLGWILVEMGMFDAADVARLVAAHIQETLLVLFERPGENFRFYEGATCHPDQVEVNLPVSDVLLRAIQFHDELNRIREAFPSSGAVLARTGLPTPPEVSGHRLASRLFAAIDGRKTLGDLVAGSRAAEHPVLRLLFRLREMAVVDVAEVRPPDPDRLLLLDRPPRPSPRPLHVPPDTASARAGEAESLVRASDVSVELEAARRLMARAEWIAALELLNATSQLAPDDGELGRLLADAEAGLTASAARRGMASASVPVVVAATAPAAGLEPDETYLLDLIDGEFDVQALIARASLREADVVETLERLLDKGAIELFDPAAAQPAEG